MLDGELWHGFVSTALGGGCVFGSEFWLSRVVMGKPYSVFKC